MSVAKYFVFPISLVLILAINAYFVSNLFYIKIWWLDIVVHAVGGFFVAAFYRAFISQRSFIGLCVFMFAVGVTWETLEFLFVGPYFGTKNASFSNSLWILDTLKDLTVDILSGVLWWWITTSYNKSNA